MTKSPIRLALPPSLGPSVAGEKARRLDASGTHADFGQKWQIGETLGSPSGDQ